MQLKGLVFGVGKLLRNEVDGWATTKGGTPHVYPDHPPDDLSASSYPRATIDIISYESETSDVTKSVFIGDVLMDVTVYAVNSGEIYDLMSDTHQAIVDYQDHEDYQYDYDKDEPLLENWKFVSDGTIGPLLDNESEKGLTRYNKNIEFEWKHATHKQTQ